MDMSAAYDNTAAIQPNAAPQPSPGIAISGNAPPPQQQQMQPAPQAQQQPAAPPKLDTTGWEPVQPQQGQQQPQLDTTGWEPVQPQGTTLGSIASGTEQSIESRLASQGAAQEQYMSGNMSANDTGAFAVKTAINTPIGIGSDVIGGLMQAAAHEAPDVVKDKAEAALQSFLSTDAGKMTVDALQKGGEYWNSFQSEHPDAAEYIKGIANVGSLVLGGGTAKTAGEAATQVGKETLETAGNALVDTAKGEYAQLKPTPDMGSKVADYANIKPNEMQQPSVMSDAHAQHLVTEQQKLDAMNKQPATASWMEPARQDAIRLQAAKVDQLREEYGLGDKTNEAFRPATEAPTPSPADIGAAKSAEQAPTDLPISEQLRKQSSAKYNSIGNAEMPPETMNGFLSGVNSAHPEDKELAVAIGQNPEQKYIAGLNNLVDKPLPLQRAKAIYEDLGEKADKNVLDNGHLTNEGRVYQDMQAKLWDSIQGTPGTPEWQQAKKDWQQSIKLGQIEKMQAMAANKGQPANSLRTAINNFVANPAKTRGWSDDEVNALKAAGEAGTKDEILNAIGSRLTPYFTGAIGATAGSMVGGPLGTVIGSAAGDLAGIPLGKVARSGALNRATTKVNAAKTAILKNTSTKGEGLLQQINPKVKK